MKAAQSVKQMQGGHPLCPGLPWHSTALVFLLIEKRICFGAGTSGGGAQKLLELLVLQHLQGLLGDQLS